MRERIGGETERSRLWPGIIPPLGLTVILALLAWLFAVKLEADQKAAGQAASDLAARAVLWSKTVLEAAERRAAALASARLESRRKRERELLLEAGSVLDAAHRQLAPLLNQDGRSAARRRRVGAFPSGLDAARLFLELPPPDRREDATLAALQASAPELAKLLLAGHRLSVVEDYSRELLSLGGGAGQGKILSVPLIKEFVFNDGTAVRNWAIRVEASAPDDQPPPGAAELAERLSEPYAEFAASPTGVAWRGWLVGPDGPAAAFSAAVGAAERTPLPGVAGKWTETGDGKWAWLEVGGRNQDFPWRLAVAAIIDRPAPPLEFLQELRQDDRWGSTLAVTAFFALAGWLWFLRGFFTAAGEAVPAAGALKAAPRNAENRPILVRDPALSRDIPDVPVIVADIGSDGDVTLRRTPPGGSGRAGPGLPDGSLARLQSIHRGGPARPGSRVLDQARSQVLRELAARVRQPAEPADSRAAESRPAARAAARVQGSRTAVISRAGREVRPGFEPRQEAGP